MLTLLKPFYELYEQNNFFDNLLFDNKYNNKQTNFMPDVDIEENENKFIFYIDLPGVSEENLKIEVEKDCLILSGIYDRKEKNHNYYQERKSGKFYRSFTLSNNIDFDKIEASYKQGVLIISLPKKENTKSRRIQLNTLSSASV